MKPSGLSWRIGVAFLLLTLVVTASVVVYMRVRIAADGRARLEAMAAKNAAFLAQASMPPTERLATDLRRVTGFDVFFRRNGTLVPAVAHADVAASLRAAPADGRARQVGDLRYVAVGATETVDLLLADRPGGALLDPRIVQVVLVSWGVSLLLALFVGRGVVRPLRRLAAQVANLERPEPLRLTETARRDEIGDVARALVATHGDLHAERERRLRAEKLAVLGRMTASLAHELQNPVAAIKLQAQLWASGNADSPGAVIEREAVRIEELVNQWMFLTRPEPPAMARCDVGELLDDLLRSNAGRLDHCAVRVRLQKRGALELVCDRNRLRQVFSNLMTNAMQAMPDGGELAITAVCAAGCVTVTFRDQGRGFSDEALRRFGEFFFSEKEGGMGIGLAVAAEIVAAHGGRLHVANADQGARVTVTLPLAGEVAR